MCRGPPAPSGDLPEDFYRLCSFLKLLPNYFILGGRRAWDHPSPVSSNWLVHVREGWCSCTQMQFTYSEKCTIQSVFTDLYQDTEHF